MARVLLAIEFDLEAQLLEGIVGAGHDVVDRVHGAEAVAAAIRTTRPDVVILDAAPHTLSREVLLESDRYGCRPVAIATSVDDHRAALATGLHEVVEASRGWAGVEPFVRGVGGRVPPPGMGAEEGAARSTGYGLPPSAGVESGAIGRAASDGASGRARPRSAAERGGELDDGIRDGAGEGLHLADAGETAPSERRRDRRRRERGGAGTPTTRGSATAGHATDSGRGASRSSSDRDRRCDGDGPFAALRSMRRGGSGRSVRAPRASRGDPGGPLCDDAPGGVVVVWGPTGAPGRTTTAIALAASLAARGLDVLLVDADVHGGAVAPALGITDEAPGFAAACRLAGADGLSTAELARVSATHGAPHESFRVLTGIPNPFRWTELTRDRVAATLVRLREEAAVVVVDVGFNLETDEELMTDVFGPRRNAATLAVLDAADLVVAVTGADATSLQRFLRARHELRELVPETPLELVVNRVRASALGIGAAEQVRAVLRRFGGIERATLVPFDQPAHDRAVLTAAAVTTASPRSACARALERAADAVLDALDGIARVRGGERDRARAEASGDGSAGAARTAPEGLAGASVPAPRPWRSSDPGAGEFDRPSF